MAENSNNAHGDATPTSTTAEDIGTTTTKYVYGIDFGGYSFTVAKRRDNEVADVFLNGLSNRETPMLVTFDGLHRWLGEPAMSRANSNPSNTITDILGLLGVTKKEYLEKATIHNRFQPLESQPADEIIKVQVKYRLSDSEDETATFTGLELLGMVFSEIKKMTSSATTDKDGEVTVSLSIAHPMYEDVKRIEAIREAAMIAGWSPESVNLIPAPLAAATTWAEKFQASNEKHEEDKGLAMTTMAILDVGHKSATMSILKYVGADEDTGIPLVKLVEHKTDETLGVHAIDCQLFEYMKKKLQEDHKITVQPASRMGARLLSECGKARKILSANDSTSLVLECFGEDEKDFKFMVTRQELETACKDLQSRLSALITDVLEKSKVTSEILHCFEMIGGGTRVNFVRKIASEKMGSGKLTQTLDSTSSIALGAATAPSKVNDTTAQDSASTATISETLSTLKDAEAKRCAQDTLLKKIEDEKNNLEAYIYETRSAGTGGEFKDKFDAEKTCPLLDEAEDWLFSDEAMALSKEGITTKRLEKLQQEVKTLNPVFFEEIEKQRVEKEKQMEEERKRMLAEQEANKEEGDDHDNRKLKKADRMRFVKKNKDEGTELFKGGNYKPAAIRYVKSLVHAGKFLDDINDDDKKEIEGLKLSLHLNLAQCYIKMSEWKRAKHSCDSALDIDQNSIKGLFRRAQAHYQTRDFDAALADCKQAVKVDANNKSVLKLMAQVQTQIKAQLDKEKKMYGKMFG